MRERSNMILHIAMLFLIQAYLLASPSKAESVITMHNDIGLTEIDPEMADHVDWTKHVCRRRCINGTAPMECYYTFKVEHYYTMSKACYDCPFNVTDCFRPHCVPADGIKRSILSVNRQVPGPSIEVCQGDRIIVDVINLLHAESTTMHWHGIHHVRTPYMDGVPYIAQCPIPSGATFRYNFVATEAGTHFWHSHIGFQRGDGLFGPLIVRVPPKNDWHKDLYDVDEHTLTLSDWIHKMGLDKFLGHHHSNDDNKAPVLLVNGLGRFNIVDDENATSAQMPTETFVVKQNLRYRFRLINAEFLNCPIEVSIDNHTLYVISSDGRDIEPVQAESLVSYGGERFDFVVKMDQKVGNYWIRFRGLMDCDERFFSAYQVAVLRYEGAPEEDPESEMSYDRVPNNSLGPQVNALNEGTETNNSIPIPLLNAIDEDDVTSIRNPDYQFYIHYDFYAKDNPHFHRENLYGFYQVNDHKQRLYTPQLNHISMKLPSFPVLPQREHADSSKFCNSSTVKHCKEKFCACTHVLQVRLNSVVEVVLVDEGVTFDANHPFHIHGYQFRVVAMEKIGSNVTIEEVKRLDAAGLIERKLNRAPLKDTVTVPDGGYTIFRFYANNPGYWLFHCHIEFHAEIGMSLIFKVGEHEDIAPVPPNFPRCGDWKPTNNEAHSSITETSGEFQNSTENIVDVGENDVQLTDKLRFGVKLLRLVLGDSHAFSSAPSPVSSMFFLIFSITFVFCVYL